MMNEKFMELADQLKWESDVSYGELMRFAELIVRECVGLVNEHQQHNNPNDSLLALKIKEHFGVK